MSKPTPGLLRSDEIGFIVDEGDGLLFEAISREAEEIAPVFVALYNAACQINPSNPLAVAEAIPKMYKALCLVSDMWSYAEPGTPLDKMLLLVRHILRSIKDADEKENKEIRSILARIEGKGE